MFANADLMTCARINTWAGVRDEMALTEWLLSDERSYRIAAARFRDLGRLPARAAKYLGGTSCDVQDPAVIQCSKRTYDTVPEPEAAALSQKIISAAGHELGLMSALKTITETMLCAVVKYLRVTMALTRLGDAINNTDLNAPEPPVKDAPKAKPGSAPPKCSRRSFRWALSPAKAYGFDEMKARYGYDVRGTSAYWIEKRANSLRRRWEVYHASTPKNLTPKKSKGDPPEPQKLTLTPDIDAPLTTKHFEPADADYNSIWPPIVLPAGPPTRDAAQEAFVQALNTDTEAKPIKLTSALAARLNPSTAKNGHPANGKDGRRDRFFPNQIAANTAVPALVSDRGARVSVLSVGLSAATRAQPKPVKANRKTRRANASKRRQLCRAPP